MARNRSPSQATLASTLNITGIDISLARDSHKTIGSVKLGVKNVVRDVQKTMRAGDIHREEFSPALILDPDDHISVSVNCSSQFRKRVDITIDIDLRDIESYRKKARNVEVVVTGYQSFLATTTQIIQSCSQFRLLIIGNSGVGKSSLIRKVFGVEEVHTSETTRGIANIDQEFVSPTNERFVVHDSLGFEAADERNMDIVKQFVARRKTMPIKDQLHAVWLCLEIPYSGGRLLEAGVEKFLQRRNEILGNSTPFLLLPRCSRIIYQRSIVPLVVVLTKVDLLDIQLEIDLPVNKALEHYKSSHMKERCIGPLRETAGSDIVHVTVSSEEGYSQSLSDLVKATNENMAKYHVDEAPRALASMAQRVSIKEKLELSIAYVSFGICLFPPLLTSITASGSKVRPHFRDPVQLLRMAIEYWKMLLKSAVFRGHTLKECLQVIHKDIINVWNFNDPDQVRFSPLTPPARVNYVSNVL
ncbi:hypothetical protein J3R83DRAFT_4651 [Lanmaoa asiatica]|nr:hypothetical protein J3R83DRAFT_4651 [Lanmaoa asiatica]